MLLSDQIRPNANYSSPLLPPPPPPLPYPAAPGPEQQGLDQGEASKVDETLEIHNGGRLPNTARETVQNPADFKAALKHF